MNDLTQKGTNMPSLIIPLKGLYESVLRPVVHKVADDVKKWTAIPPETPVRIYNESEADHNPGSTVDGGSRNKFGASSKVTITVTERYKEDAVINTALRTMDEPYVFLDKPLNIAIKATRSYNEVVLSFEYRAKSRGEVEAWRNDVKMRMAEDRQALLHEVDYHFEIPFNVQLMLAHFHELREKQAGYGDTLGEWFEQSFTKRSTVLTNSNGTLSHRVINERSVGIQGWFDFTEPEEADKRSENSTWTVTFNYHFNYQKPVGVNFVYPPLIHNQKIDDSMLTKKPRYRLEDRPRMQGWPRTRSNYETVADMHELPADPLSGMRVPVWDEWVPKHVHPGTTTLATWLILIDPRDPTMVFDLNNLGKRKFTEVYMNFFKDAHKNLTVRGKSILHFGLFRGTIPVEDEALYIDENLIVRTRVPMDLRRDYHIRFSMLNQKSAFTPDAYDDAMKHQDMLLDLWSSALPELDREYMETLMPFPPNIWDWYYDNFNRLPGNSAIQNIHGHFVDQRRVQTTTIISTRD